MTLDVLIIGGGPAGTTTALLLAEAGWTVGLIEKKEFPRRKVCGEFISVTSLSLLQKLGLEEFYLTNGGPEINKVGLYADDVILTANMPPSNSSKNLWGRALAREYLDTELINKAKLEGVRVWQPCEAIKLHRRQEDGVFLCSVKENNKITEIIAPLVVIANGSWEKRIEQSETKIHQSTDLLAFKAHFKNVDLPTNLMPLLAFRGGYGGIVHSSMQKVTLSCCIRRDILHDLRSKNPGTQAGETVYKYLLSQCRGVREALGSAEREGEWLAVGPIRPGIRSCYKDGIFFVGNIAGEAHPIVAEGISMAMQSAWLLAHSLTQFNLNTKNIHNLDDVGIYYSKQWRKYFSTRIHASAFFAQLAMMNSWPRSLVLPVLKQFPALLTLGARFSGKVQQVVPMNKS
ncbi:FAD dependent oxidoreductase [Legionella steigerwaltii]|uniref:Protein CbrA n=1 Tax=Legionella steigerwaltii TaxID=460 RepID=A0A378LB01_9GAMM|nr:FAD-dependent oxidoreductase [Legionella steigerwaltii]KTD77738.1 FAD dependent oxidoreductase [Legionella steigerwaltii]STY23048.1 FAD dependent oxidoreductase [Legionella steigerwaltii]